MNNPQQAVTYQNYAMMGIVFKASPPNLFIGGPVLSPSGFHFAKLSVASPVEPPLKACGNDGPRRGDSLNTAIC